MSATEQLSHVTATLAIDFVIVGGGIAGLASAFALARAGHRAVVLEKADGVKNRGLGGIRLPPNMTKILFHWGLKQQVKQHALTAYPILFQRYETGQFLGGQVWTDSLLEETCGEFLLTTHGELHGVLTDAVIASGVQLRTNVEVIEVNGEERTVRLSSGEVLKADVIIGADGVRGRCRAAVTGHEERGTPIGVSMYDTWVEGNKMPPDFAQFLEDRSNMFSTLDTVLMAFGNRCAGHGYPIRGGSAFAFCYFQEDDDTTDGSYEDAPSVRLAGMVVGAEPRFQFVSDNSELAIRIPIREYKDLEDWVDDSERVVVIGQAAHCFPPGSIQGSAMAVEDAAVLGKLFSHLSSTSQIESFLWAFQDLRQSRNRACMVGEMLNVHMQMLEDGEEQRARDEMMLSRHEAGKHVFDAEEGEENNPVWEEIRAMFAYDCEDEADNWWLQWGRLRQRAQEREQETSEGRGAFSCAIQVSASVEH
ncbi:FAD/NAD-P-binding domain-containing protein [Amylocystis lapponica]|nr:FAD/NAD-P-binding domain-containing protein [Amylocystis lapponica]